jgi:serine/threonine protein kinase
MWTDIHQRNAALKEVQLLKGLRHPNIIEYLGYQNFEEQKTFSIYMECCDTSLQGLVTDYASKG